jgi:hypothetical protein
LDYLWSAAQAKGSIVALMVSKDLIEQTGALPPEELNHDSGKHCLAEMKTCGLEVHQLAAAG